MKRLPSKSSECPKKFGGQREKFQTLETLGFQSSVPLRISGVQKPENHPKIVPSAELIMDTENLQGLKQILTYLAVLRIPISSRFYFWGSRDFSLQ